MQNSDKEVVKIRDRVGGRGGKFVVKIEKNIKKSKVDFQKYEIEIIRKIRKIREKDDRKSKKKRIG
jgi:hypothetical protein